MDCCETFYILALFILLSFWISTKQDKDQPAPTTTSAPNVTAFAEELTLIPVVLWHGMGDTCCLPFSLGHIETVIKENTADTYVHSLKIGGNFIDDYKSGFLTHPNKQLDYVCDAIKNDKKLVNGYNAIGFSQGGQFL